MRERHVTLRDGEKVFLRPLTPEDAALYPDFLAEVTADDLRLRFFAPMRQVCPSSSTSSSTTIRTRRWPSSPSRRLPATCSAWCGCMTTPTADTAEFAILLRSRLKGHGLGWLMMKHMIAYAKDKGLETVRGQVLAENATMLTMCEELGFHVSDDPLERGVKLVTLPLAEVPAEAMP